MTCEHLLTVQHDLFVQSEQVGGPGRAFKANSQYQYSEVINVSRIVEIPGQNTGSCFSDNYIFWPVVSWFVQGRNRRITIENFVYNEQSDQFLQADNFSVKHVQSGVTQTANLISFNPQDGLNEYQVSATVHGRTIGAVFFVVITDETFTNIVYMQVVGDYPSGSWSPVASAYAPTDPIPVASVDFGDGNSEELIKEFTTILDQEPIGLASDLYTRDQHEYQSNSIFIKRYSFTMPGIGTAYIETVVETSDCVTEPPTIIKRPCCPIRGWGRFFRIVCDDYSYLIHETDAFITTIPIDKEDQDAVKKINNNRMDDSAIIGPTNNYDGFTWKPCPRDIWKQANTNPM